MPFETSVLWLIQCVPAIDVSVSGKYEKTGVIETIWKVIDRLNWNSMVECLEKQQLEDTRVVDVPMLMFDISSDLTIPRNFRIMSLSRSLPAQVYHCRFAKRIEFENSFGILGPFFVLFLFFSFSFLLRPPLVLVMKAQSMEEYWYSNTCWLWFS